MDGGQLGHAFLPRHFLFPNHPNNLSGDVDVISLSNIAFGSVCLMLGIESLFQRFDL